jgi:ketosteroid isomerase-like protein
MTFEHPILTVERARQAACLAGEAERVAEFMSDDCVYVHSSAQAESKEEMLERFRAGTLVYKALDMSAVSVRAYGDVVLINGDMHIDVITNGAHKDFVSRYLQVWRTENGVSKMVSWQSTPIPN